MSIAGHAGPELPEQLNKMDLGGREGGMEGLRDGGREGRRGGRKVGRERGRSRGEMTVKLLTSRLIVFIDG